MKKLTFLNDKLKSRKCVSPVKEQKCLGSEILTSWPSMSKEKSVSISHFYLLFFWIPNDIIFLNHVIYNPKHLCGSDYLPFIGGFMTIKDS